MGDIPTNPYQFHVVQPGYTPNPRANPASKATRNRRANETSGKIIATHPEDGVVGALSFSHSEWSGGGQGRGVDVVMVDPRHRGPEFRQGGRGAGAGGVAGAMYNIASREMGYKLGHSKTLSEKGAKFAERVGGPTQSGLPPRANINLPDVMGPGDLNTDVLRDDLASRATAVDPVIGRALTPTRQKQSRQRKPVQETIPGQDWSQYDPPPPKRGANLRSKKKK